MPPNRPLHLTAPSRAHAALARGDIVDARAAGERHIVSRPSSSHLSAK